MAKKMKNNEKKADREFKIVGAEAPKKTPVFIRHERMPPDFEMWWAMRRGKLNLDEKMKAVIKIHFEARGFMKNKKFDEGLEDFGIKA